LAHREHRARPGPLRGAVLLPPAARGQAPPRASRDGGHLAPGHAAARPPLARDAQSPSCRDGAELARRHSSGRLYRCLSGGLRLVARTPGPGAFARPAPAGIDRLRERLTGTSEKLATMPRRNSKMSKHHTALAGIGFVLALALAAGPAFAGDVTGTIKYTGKVPNLKP